MAIFTTVVDFRGLASLTLSTSSLSFIQQTPRFPRSLDADDEILSNTAQRRPETWRINPFQEQWKFCVSQHGVRVRRNLFLFLPNSTDGPFSFSPLLD